MSEQDRDRAAWTWTQASRRDGGGGGILLRGSGRPCPALGWPPRARARSSSASLFAYWPLVYSPVTAALSFCEFEARHGVIRHSHLCMALRSLTGESEPRDPQEAAHVGSARPSPRCVGTGGGVSGLRNIAVRFLEKEFCSPTPPSKNKCLSGPLPLRST